MAHLCSAASATHLICHPSLVAQGRVALSACPAVTVLDMAPRSVWQQNSPGIPIIKSPLSPGEEAHLTALVMHTSGSTGMPKVNTLMKI